MTENVSAHLEREAPLPPGHSLAAARADEADPDPEALVPHFGKGVDLSTEDDAPPSRHLRGEENAHRRRGVHLDLLRQGILILLSFLQSDLTLDVIYRDRQKGMAVC